MSRPQVFLDLDRTLFRTTMGHEIWQGIARKFPTVDASAAYAERSRFYRYSDGMYYYDLSAQLRELGFEPHHVYDSVRAGLADGRFEFTGVAELVACARLRAEVKIFTYGADEYQRFKASLCPSLVGIEVITTTVRKAKFLQIQDECWLIDDKPLWDELPDRVHFIQVALEHGLAVDSRAVTSLAEAKEKLAYELELH